MPSDELTQRRYQLALRVVRQWLNLRALKRGGMGNDPDLPHCPKAGVNLPEGWEKAPVEMRYLYTIFLAIDTCFRLKRKKISTWLADPSLQDGWVYFVRSFTYEDFVKTLGEQKEMSTCTGLAALDHANTKYSQGYCSDGLRDDNAGEKYGNMDYAVASAWKHFSGLMFFLLSYNIMCQWSKNLKERLLKLPPALRFHLAQFFRFSRYSSSWAPHNLTWKESSASGPRAGRWAASTREMGLGSRQDTLDDFWHYWNWNKVVGMGSTLRTRLLKATKELARQSEALRDFTQAQQDDAPAWKQAVDDFELGTSTCKPAVTLRTIELELTREQEREQASNLVRDAAEDTMTEYLMLGLEIRGATLAADLSANKSPTSKELTGLCDSSHEDLPPNQEAAPVDQAEAERTPLFLPSALSQAESLPPVRPGPCCWRRRGFATRNATKAWGTSATNTRSRGLVDGQQRKVDLGAATYRQARAARLALGHIAGASGWQLLEKGDLRLPEDEEEAKRRKQQAMKGKRKEAAQVNNNGEVRGVPGMGEKNRLVSWIWLSTGSSWGVVEPEMHACVRAEWCKAYARVKRWREEVLLLQEEMVRCLRTLEWQAGTWDRPDEGASSQSSGIDEDGIAGGGKETDDEYGHQSTSEEEPVAGGSGGVPVASGGEEDEEEDGEGRADRDADTDARRAEMDKLLAMHAPLEEL
ncbi:hypothetical protein B0H14DRAFT_3442547 [Mycena olivaceomarginata]|nr:hypothetical protein B0H14DRAFT_3442547 [Mycena olivaceomarginata]